MEKKKRRFGEDLDWYLIPISTLKKIGVILLLAVFAGVAGYFTYTYINSDKAKARSLLKGAFTAVEQIPKIADFASRKAVYVQLQERLQQAQQALNLKDYTGVQTIAAEVLQRAGTILQDAASGSEKGVEEILDLEGKVQVQRKEQGVWEDAKPRMPLFPGDFIKTGSNGSARIMSSEANSTIIVLGPRSLHEVAQSITSAGGGEEHNFKMIAGTTDIFTNEKGIQVQTIASNFKLDPNSQANILVENSREEFRNQRGKGHLTVAGQEMEIDPLTRVTVSGGKPSEKQQFLAAPRLLEPANGKTLSFSPGMKVKLQWEKVAGAAKYHVQVSSSQFFVDNLGEKVKPEANQSLTISVPANYYWRVAAIDAKGVEGSPGNPYNFKVVPPGQVPQGNKTPPPLTVSASAPLGSMCPIKGKTNPGNAVTVDDEDALMNEDGSFQANVTLKSVGYNTIVVKAVDPNGNETVKKLQVFVPDY